MATSHKEAFASNLKKYLHEKGKTRKQLCDDTGIKYSTLTEWANGRKFPRMEKVEIIANYLGIKKSDLIEIKEFYAETTSPEKIGNQLKLARLSKGYTQAELAKILGVGQSAIGKWERGVVVNIKRNIIQKIATALEVSPLLLVSNVPKEETIIISSSDFAPEDFKQIKNFIQYVKSKQPKNFE